MVEVGKKRGSAKGFPVVEFIGKSLNGGLIEFHEDDEGVVHVTLYRLDLPGVRIYVNDGAKVSEFSKE
jgi:hypothetical protein